MDLVTMQLDELTPADYNPRVELTYDETAYQALRSSIVNYGLVEPLLWNKRTGRLVSGHQRLNVLQDLGHTEAPVVVLDLDEPREKALNIALNKIDGRWDNDKLGQLLFELEQDKVDLTRLGFEKWEADDIIKMAGVFAPIDEIPTGDEDEDPPPRGPYIDPDVAWFTVSYSVTHDERRVINDAIAEVKRTHDLQSSSEAVVAMAEGFLA